MMMKVYVGYRKDQPEIKLGFGSHRSATGKGVALNSRT